MTRPDPMWLKEVIESLGPLHSALEPFIVNRPPGKQGERVTSSDGTEHPAPGHWTAVAIRADIHHFAYAHAKMLVEDRDITMKMPSTTEGLLSFVAMFPGYFADHDNPLIAYEILPEALTLASRAKSAIDPDSGAHKTPIGPCSEDGCDGVYRIHWREGEGGDDERAWKMRQSRPVARCTSDAEHRIDAMLYGAGRG